MNRASAWAALAKQVGALYEGRQSQEDVDKYLDNWCRAQELVADPNDSDRCALALFLTRHSAMPVSVVDNPPSSLWAQAEFASDGWVHVPLPTGQMFEEWVPTDVRKARRTAKPATQRKRLADPLWAALDAAGVEYVREPDWDGKPSAMVAIAGDKQALVFVRRCWYFRHATHQADTGAALVKENVAMHDAAVAKAKAQGWKVYTIYECQLDAAPELVAQDLLAAGAKESRHGAKDQRVAAEDGDDDASGVSVPADEGE